MRGAMPPLPNTPSLCGAQKSTRKTIPLLLHNNNNNNNNNNNIDKSNNIKGRGQVPVLNQAPRYEDVLGVEVYLHAFLTSALDGGEWSVSRPGRFTPREIPPVPIE
jgi:hypothetical protein